MHSESDGPVDVEAYRTVIVEIAAARLNFHTHSIGNISLPKTKFSIQNAQKSSVSRIQLDRLQQFHLQFVPFDQKLEGLVLLLHSETQLLVVLYNESDFFRL